MTCYATGFSQSDIAFIRTVFDDPRGWRRKGISIKLVDSTRAPDFTLTKLSTRELLRLYPQSWLRGLSITDRSMKPPRVYINAENWALLPLVKGCEYTNLSSYRAAVLNHEVAHVLGFDHVGCARAGEPADVRQQPSKPLGGCKPTPHVFLYPQSPVKA